MKEALLNGRNFSHKDVSFNVHGVPLTSLDDLEISENTTREFSYGTGQLPVGYGDGEDDPVDVTFSLSLTEAEALAAASPENNEKRLEPFDIPITFVNGAKTFARVLKNVLIQGKSDSSSTGTTDIKRNYTAQCSNIKPL